MAFILGFVIYFDLKLVIVINKNVREKKYIMCNYTLK